MAAHHRCVPVGDDSLALSGSQTQPPPPATALHSSQTQVTPVRFPLQGAPLIDALPSPAFPGSSFALCANLAKAPYAFSQILPAAGCLATLGWHLAAAGLINAAVRRAGSGECGRLLTWPPGR